MGIRGAKPKPTALHELHGTLRKQRHQHRLDGEPVPSSDIGSAPEWMTGDQKDQWDHAVQYAPRGVLKQIDSGTLTVWVEAAERHRRACMAQSAFEEKWGGMVATTPDGAFIHSPYISIIARAGTTMLKAAGELGFSPTSRPRLAAQRGMSALSTSDINAPDELELLLRTRPPQHPHRG